MDRFLREARRLSRLGAVMALVSALGVIQVSAGTATGKFSGYAMGRLKGSSGQCIIQGYFANHIPGYCGDPAGYWPWGTRIDTLPVFFHEQWGTIFSRTSFYLYDNGDASCLMGSYWVDIYHGRFKWPSQPCTCTGYSQPVEHVCTDGMTNSCVDAQCFPVHMRTYSYTTP
jgi:hypothetical protein